MMTSKQIAAPGAVEFELAEDGTVSGLWLNGYDYSDKEEVKQAILRLIGEHEMLKLWAAACDDFASISKDPIDSFKRSIERTWDIEQ